MTSQDDLDSYVDAGVLVSVELVNTLAIEWAGGKREAGGDPMGALQQLLAVDPPSVARLRESDVPEFVALANSLRGIFANVSDGDIDTAAARLNLLLARHPAHPYLAKEHGRWRLHHHAVDAALVAMWTSICAEGLARTIGGGYSDRLGTCNATRCDRVYVDLSKNTSRRFCSTACQNRMKAAAFRSRHVAAG